MYELRWPDIPPTVPTLFSYSSLNDAEHCPRRYWLRRATYPGLNRYPEQPTPAALTGVIVHGVLEDLGRESRGEERGDDWEDLLRSFPLRAVTLARYRQAIASLAANPRTPARLERHVTIDECIALVKRMVSTLDDTSIPGTLRQSTVGQSAGAGRASESIAVPGLLAEWDIRLERFGLMARIDLVSTATGGDSITEFKTGVPRSEHSAQVRLYAAMWTGATQRFVRRIQVMYPDGTVVASDGPTREESMALLIRTQKRAEELRTELDDVVPKARPSSLTCEYCAVRQLCGEYWRRATPVTQRKEVEELADVDGQIPATFDVQILLNQARWLGPHQFSVPGSSGQVVVVLPPRAVPAGASQCQSVRLLRVFAVREGITTRVLFADNSEAFWLRASDDRLIHA